MVTTISSTCKSIVTFTVSLSNTSYFKSARLAGRNVGEAVFSVSIGGERQPEEMGLQRAFERSATWHIIITE